ncbi:LPS export ABC transporter periplasmic protein LptC [Mangrovibacterium marinum]|uniref:LPS export ABC transporter protein LptC n=1 Tax=Mangrovibacterium marinum TaxID=1639118 RepID=A0A2T5C1Z2_9BACT|nr:LPS export ABC transporter periplasmic protein LptC [Mangrovibacterium marinum]PTN08718.1 LPS export ABC transporter protein LptC [Mangrovibacterium marinum]
MQNRPFKIRHTKQASIAILLTGIAMLFFSCANKIEKIKEFAAAEKLPGMEAEHFEMLYSDSAVVRFKLIAPKLIRYDQEKEPFMEFPEGIEIEKYDSQMKVVSRITANYARYLDKEDKWLAKNNVVAINEQGDSLKTEELIWEEKKGKIYTDQFVKIIRQDQVINGIGMESDQDLSNWEIKKPTGTLYLDVTE